jgi:hypothetical protein
MTVDSRRAGHYELSVGTDGPLGQGCGRASGSGVGLRGTIGMRSLYAERPAMNPGKRQAAVAGRSVISNTSRVVLKLIVGLLIGRAPVTSEGAARA